MELLEANRGCSCCVPAKEADLIQFSHPRRVWTRPGCYFRCGDAVGKVVEIVTDGPGFVRVFAKPVGGVASETTQPIHDIRSGSYNDAEDAEFHEELQEELKRKREEGDVSAPESAASAKRPRDEKPSRGVARAGKALNQLYKANANADESFEQFADRLVEDTDILEDIGVAAAFIETGPAGETAAEEGMQLVQDWADKKERDALVYAWESRHVYDEHKESDDPPAKQRKYNIVPDWDE